MTPLQFERQHAPQWQAFEAQLQALMAPRFNPFRRRKAIAGSDGAAFAADYRRCCEQLALARSRGYPLHVVERLERLTADGHQLIYRGHSWGLAHLVALASRDFPRAVRAHGRYVGLALALFLVPALLLGLCVARRPELVTTVVDAATAADFERMYDGAEQALGRTRDASTDLQMFGYYIGHNIGIAFQCFAGGVFLGLGSCWFLVQNGLFLGAVGGYLVARGLAVNFFTFVITHSAFEVTAIVLAGAAGLRIGHALLAPGRRRRSESLALAGRETAVILYGVVAMLVIAAAIEAFWSSSTWLPHSAKALAAAVAWSAVLSYFLRQGRHAD